MVRPSHIRKEMRIMSWKTMEVGDRVTYHYTGFDGSGSLFCYITSVHEDHAIAMDYDAIRYWVDDETEYMFSKGWA